MQCPHCHAGNPDRARFCLNCGARLALVCPRCGSELPAQARFCLHCGAPLTPTPRASLPSYREEGEGEEGARLVQALQRLVPKSFAERLLATRGQVSSERRMVTILFSDVKGSTWHPFINPAHTFTAAPGRPRQAERPLRDGRFLPSQAGSSGRHSCQNEL